MKEKIEQYNIEALPLHKEICAYLIDQRLTFHCYNGGLQMITISTSQPQYRIVNRKTDFMTDLIQTFGLVKTKRGKDAIYYGLSTNKG